MTFIQWDKLLLAQPCVTMVCAGRPEEPGQAGSEEEPWWARDEQLPTG